MVHSKNKQRECFGKLHVNMETLNVRIMTASELEDWREREMDKEKLNYNGL